MFRGVLYASNVTVVFAFSFCNPVKVRYVFPIGRVRRKYMVQNTAGVLSYRNFTL